jgi:hypothetical protein
MRFWCCVTIALLCLSVCAGCDPRMVAQSIMNAVCPNGSSNEPGISDRVKKAREQQEMVNDLQGAPLSSENR